MPDFTGNNAAAAPGVRLSSLVRLAIAVESCVAMACVGALVAQILLVTSLVTFIVRIIGLI